MQKKSVYVRKTKGVSAAGGGVRVPEGGW
jgi:hypothetical protein